MNNNMTEKEPMDSRENQQEEGKNVSRRTALKHIGLGAAGTLGAVYGLDKLRTRKTTNTEAGGQPNVAPVSTTVPVSADAPMKVLLINGSPRRSGNTFICLSEIIDILHAEGIQTHLIQIGVNPRQGCTACNACVESGECVFTDTTYLEIVQHLSDSDGLIVGSPVYFSGPTGPLCAILDRLFYTSGELLHNKAAAAITVCRRSGGTATLDRLHKYFAFARMPIITSQYWNIAHGAAVGEVREDKEGLQIMRTLARNMAWSIRNTRLAQQVPPVKETPRERTNFVR